MLKVGEEILFESNAIAEFLDETVEPRLHPQDPIERARNRAWTDFVPTFSSALSRIYYTKTRKEMEEGLADAPRFVERLEKALTRQRGRNDGPYFNGADLSLVDCAYAPFLQRFLIADSYLKTGLLDDFPMLKAWADALLSIDTVTGAVAPEFLHEFHGNLKRRNFYVASLIEGTDRTAPE